MSAIDFIKDNIDVKINNIDIDKSQRIQCYDKAKKIARLNIIKFVKYNVRGKIFWEKRKLKSTGKIDWTVTWSMRVIIFGLMMVKFRIR